MRAVIWAVRRLRPAFRFRRNFVCDSSCRRHNVWLNANQRTIYSLSIVTEISQCRHPWYMMHRAISTDAAKVTSAGCGIV